MQRNMAANCGMDFRAAGEFVASIALRELQLLEAAGALSVAVLGPDSRSEACRGVEAQGFRSRSQSEAASQSKQDVVLHSSQCQTSRMLEDIELDRDLMALAAARLRLKQALPMLEGLLAKMYPEDGCCSKSAVDACIHTEGSSLGCEHTGEHYPDVRVTASPAVSTITGALDLSQDVHWLRAMSSDSFWQTMLQMTTVIRAQVDETAVHGRNPVTGCCNG